MDRHTPVRLAYKTFEPKESANEDLPPIIFLHGITVSKEHWRNVPKIIADATKRRAYALDARNHGDSPHSDVFHFDANAADLLHFMDCMHIPKAVLVGHSMGGMTVIKAALDEPERVEKLIVEDMFARRNTTESVNRLHAHTSFVQKVLHAIPPELEEQEAVKVFIKNMEEALPEPVKSKVKGRRKNMPILALRRDDDGHYALRANMEVIWKALSGTDPLMAERKGVYEGPACFIYGKLSLLSIMDDEATIKKYFPNAEFVGLDATHDVHTDVPEEFCETVIRFLK